jgi:thiol-disulfide isomerase/thioredoxin
MLVGCTGYVDDQIVLRVDKSHVTADGVDVARFSVEFQGRDGTTSDVTDEATITNVTSGEAVQNGYFTTLASGMYTFSANYKGIPTTLSITVTAIAPEPEEPEPTSGDFYRRVGIVEFTGTWCTYCPYMASHIAGAEALYPDRSVVVVVHFKDQLATPYATTLSNYFKPSGLPAVFIDFGSEFNNTNTNATILAQRIREIVEGDTARCGIAIETSQQGTTATAKVKLRAAELGEYGIAVALVEDGITGYTQTMPDGSKQADYVHNHTLRKFYEDNIFGVSVGNVAAGEEVERAFEFDIMGYNAVNCRFVVFVTSQGAMVNAAECRLGETVGFKYERR